MIFFSIINNNLFLENSKIWGCGGNTESQLGTLTEERKAELTPLFIEKEFQAVAAGSFSSAALSKSKEIFYWGYRRENKISQPLMVYQSLYLTNSLHCGKGFIAALDSKKGVVFWGDNEDGQPLGIYNNMNYDGDDEKLVFSSDFWRKNVNDLHVGPNSIYAWTNIKNEVDYERRSASVEKITDEFMKFKEKIQCITNEEESRQMRIERDRKKKLEKEKVILKLLFLIDPI